MTPERTVGWLLRLFPPAWRARYGAELEGLILEASGDREVPWRMRVDVMVAAWRERARSLRGRGIRDAPPERARTGMILVLWAWLLFASAGVIVQKLSEHWQDATPTANAALPSAAFHCLVAGAMVGTAVLAVGTALLAPALLSFVRLGRLSEVQRTFARSVAMTLLALAGATAVILWAHHLTAHARNGHDVLYGAAVVTSGLLAVLCLASWIATVSAVARRLVLPVRTLRLEALITASLVLSMAAMTVSTVVWWQTVAEPEPGLLPAAVAMMLIASTLGGIGSRRALRASAELQTRPR